MDFRPITLADRAIFNAHYKTEYRMGSESCFTTPFCWMPCYDISFTAADDVLCVRGQSDGAPHYYLMPVGNGDRIAFLRRLLHEIDTTHFSMHQLREEDVRFLEKEMPGTFSFAPLREAAEYIYDTAALCTLAGKKLHAKRNHYNTFVNTYAYNLEEITPDNLSEVSDFVLQRCDNVNEIVAMTRLMQNYFALGVTGIILRVDGNIVAVSAGELLNGDTALIHLEKAEKDITGAYAAVNRLFIEQKFSHTAYVNREEDMGLEGLRRAKLSYHPAFLLQKYTATLCN